MSTNTSRAWSMDARLLEVFEQLRLHGRVLVIVDQPASIGALAVALATRSGCTSTPRWNAWSGR